eukprot:GHUV01035160.1.p1 GENE.GHUV01035160.1~~GHUV01035160.1.p1  ORF type:complete len:200 (+),score=85.64 GHUV01035160.1:300-899(+)
MEDDETMDSEEILAADDGHEQTDSTNKWDCIISALQDVLLDSQFETARSDFCRQHCNQFEDTQENKLCYTQLFQQYCSLVEGAIDAALTAAVPDFSMDEFAQMLEERQGELGAEVFDLLMSLSDFDIFKEEMLAQKRDMQAGPQQQQLQGVQCSAMPMHTEEQEDGEERPDLDMSLSISPLVSPTSRAHDRAPATSVAR